MHDLKVQVRVIRFPPPPLLRRVNEERVRAVGSFEVIVLI